MNNKLLYIYWCGMYPLQFPSFQFCWKFTKVLMSREEITIKLSDTCHDTMTAYCIPANLEFGTDYIFVWQHGNWKVYIIFSLNFGRASLIPPCAQKTIGWLGRAIFLFVNSPFLGLYLFLSLYFFGPSVFLLFARFLIHNYFLVQCFYCFHFLACFLLWVSLGNYFFFWFIFLVCLWQSPDFYGILASKMVGRFE